MIKKQSKKVDANKGIIYLHLKSTTYNAVVYSIYIKNEGLEELLIADAYPNKIFYTEEQAKETINKNFLDMLEKNLKNSIYYKRIKKLINA